jgi:hypothetical protein
LVHARPHEMMTTTLASPLPNGSRFCCGAAHEGPGCTRSRVNEPWSAAPTAASAC